MRSLILAGFLVLMAVPTQASEVVTINRVDFYPGGSPVYTSGVITPEIEVWGLGLPNFPDIEVGRLWPVYQSKRVSLLAGGYYTYWPLTGQHFFLPWLQGSLTTGRAELSFSVSHYLPFNDGPHITFSNEVFAGYRVNSKLRLGAATAFWDQEDAPLTIGFGPAIKAKISNRSSLNLRYLFRKEVENQFRVELIQRF